MYNLTLTPKKGNKMKSTQVFKMSQETKRALALGKWKNKEHRNTFKKVMINAELIAAYVPKSDKKDN